MVISAGTQGFVGCEMHLKNPCRISRFISARINGKWSSFKFWNTDSSWSKLYIFTWVCRLTSKLTKTGLPTKYYCNYSFFHWWVLSTWAYLISPKLEVQSFRAKSNHGPKVSMEAKGPINLPGSIQLASEQILGSQKHAMQKKLLTPRQLPQARQVPYSNWKGKSSEPIFWVPHEKIHWNHHLLTYKELSIESTVIFTACWPDTNITTKCLCLQRMSGGTTYQPDVNATCSVAKWNCRPCFTLNELILANPQFPAHSFYF